MSHRVAAGFTYGLSASSHETFDLSTIYKSMNFDFGQFWTGENIGISKTEPMTSELTALELQFEEHHIQI